jgi:hypothetical protein
MQHLTFALQSLAQLPLTWVALVGAAFLGFHRRVLLTMLLAFALRVLATWADVRHLLGRTTRRLSLPCGWGWSSTVCFAA